MSSQWNFLSLAEYGADSVAGTPPQLCQFQMHARIIFRRPFDRREIRVWPLADIGAPPVNLLSAVAQCSSGQVGDLSRLMLREGTCNLAFHS